MTEWITKKLGEVIILNYGKNLPEKNRIPGVIPVYGSNGIVGYHDKAIVNSRGILVGRKGSAGEIHFSKESFCPIDTTFYITDEDIKQLDLIFCYYALKHLNLKRILGDVGVPGLNREMAYMEYLSFPEEIIEQQIIAAVLATVQKAIELQNDLIERTTELKKSMMHKLFTEGTRGEKQKETEIGLVPESWEVVESFSVIDFFGGYAFKSEDGIKESNTQLLRMGNLYQNKLDLLRSPIYYSDDYAITYKRYVLNKGDLVISLTGTTGKEDYGFTVEINDCNKKLLLNQRVARIDLKSERVNKGYILYYLLSRKYLDILYKTAKGTKQANLSTNTMKKIHIAFPKDIEEQMEIESILRCIDQKINIHGNKKEKLEDLFRTLLHQLMTAQVRVDGLDIDLLEEVK